MILLIIVLQDSDSDTSMLAECAGGVMGMRAHQLLNPWGQRNEDSIVQMEREKASRTHMRSRLDSMSSVVDTRSPRCARMKHLEKRLKKVQLTEDRKQLIARDNRKLMEKMTDILQGKAKAPLYTPARKLEKSLNERIRREYVQKVNHDNKVMLQRLKHQTGFIDVKKMAHKRQRRANMLEVRRQKLSQCGSSVCSGMSSVNSRSLSPTAARSLLPAPFPRHSNIHGNDDARVGNNNQNSASDGVDCEQSEGFGEGGTCGVKMFRTAKQMQSDMIREGKGGFVPLPTLVQAPPPSTKPSIRYSDHDMSVSCVGGRPVQFAVHHQGCSDDGGRHPHPRGGGGGGGGGGEKIIDGSGKGRVGGGGGGGGGNNQYDHEEQGDELTSAERVRGEARRSVARGGGDGARADSGHDRLNVHADAEPSPPPPLSSSSQPAAAAAATSSPHAYHSSPAAAGTSPPRQTRGHN